MALHTLKSTKENANKIRKDSLLVASYSAVVSPLGQSIVVLVSTAYVLLHQGVIPAKLMAWQLVTMISSVLATSLRHWLKLTIRERHRLVKTGSYRYLLHPSYTGLIASLLTYVAVVGYVGMWTYSMQPRLPIPIPGTLVALAVLWYQIAVFFNRAAVEEAMLAQVFGQEWADHAATRWRLVPLIY